MQHGLIHVKQEQFLEPPSAHVFENRLEVCMLNKLSSDLRATVNQQVFLAVAKLLLKQVHVDKGLNVVGNQFVVRLYGFLRVRPSISIVILVA